MPLLNLTGDRKQEYFTEGLAEELTSELARYQELRVIAYQSTRRWKGKKIDPRAAGQALVAAQKGAAPGTGEPAYSGCSGPCAFLPQ